MYLLCSDWSIRCLEEKEEEKAEENCHLLITAVVPTRAVIKIPTIPQGVNSVSCFFEEEGLTGLRPNNANNVQLICSSIWVYRAVGLFKMRKFEICISES